jgi:hypothetical protein
MRPKPGRARSTSGPTASISVDEDIHFLFKQGRRAISVPLTLVMRDFSRSLADTPNRKSDRIQARTAQIPRLIVRPLGQSWPRGTYVGCSAAVDQGHKRHRRSQTRDQLEPWRSVKTVGSAYVGSNPTPATTCENGPLTAETRPGGRFLRVTPCIRVFHCGSMRCGVHGRIADGVWAVRTVGAHRRLFHGRPRTGRVGVFRLDMRRRVGRASLCPPGGPGGSPGVGGKGRCA